MKRLRPRLTYANVMATIAVFVAFGGASYAALKVPKNSIGAKQLKAGAVTPAKLSAAAKDGMVGERGPTGPQGPPGANGAPGAPATKLFAAINGIGDVISSGSPVTAERTGEGTYLVNFAQETQHCAVVASQGSAPDFAHPGGATGTQQGYGARVEMASPSHPGDEFAPGFPVVTSVGVETFSGSILTNSSFFIAAFC